MESSKVLLFGDLSCSYEDSLRELLRVRDNALLASFFEQVGARIRDEIGQLGTQQQRLFPRFTTLTDLFSKVGETNGTPVLRFSLLSICQIGQFINYFGRDGRVYPAQKDALCLGICAGSFAAAAVCASQSLAELVPVATEAVLVAFRTALCSFVAKSDIVGNDSEQVGSWSAVVPGTEEGLKDKIQNYVAAEKLQSTWQPYISAVTPSHATISGPPSVLNHFLTTYQLKSHSLSIESPFHAKHLFTGSYIDSIITEKTGDVGSSSQKAFPKLYSPSNGNSILTPSYKALLTEVVQDSLCKKVRWELVLNNAVKDVLRRSVDSATIIPFCSNAAQLVATELTRAGIETKVNQVKPVPESIKGQKGHFADSKIAIIGYSGRFPDSPSNEEFWDLLRAGKDVHREIPEDRFNWKTHYDPTGKTKNTSRVKYGCFIKEPELFDARFFNISPREAENTDPAQRLAITTVYEAMEMAGMVPNRTPSTQQDRIGVFFGTTSDDWREVNSGQDVDTYFIPGGNRAFVPGRISYFFRFSGPSLSMDTACSSSFAAIQTACAYLWRDECDTAVAGGTNVLTNPDNFVGLDRGHFLSTTGNCNPFDDGASGYCRADAVGSVILKRLEDAEMDNDPIFGVIAGATTNHCGQTDSITRPHEGDQTSVFKRIIRNAGVNPMDVSYVEMHGTGTQAGDATEMNSVLSVFVPERQRMPRHPIYLGAMKANVGHAGSASGVSSLIKVLMMMKHSEIPPHCGIKTKINHNYPLDLKERNVNIALEPTPWRRDAVPCGKRYAFLNNFSAAGGNTAVLLEDAPLYKAKAAADPRAFHIITLSSKTAKSLKGNMEALIKHLESNPELPISSLSYTTTARRMQHNYRVAVVGSDATSIAQSLKNKLPSFEPKTIPPAAKVAKVAFVFTGQGAFYSGLGKQLFSLVSSFREDILRFDRMATQQGFPSFINVIRDSNASEANDPIVAQLAIACVQMALSALWTSWGIRPSFTMGHSLGEYAALFTSGVISASDAIFLVGTRAQLLVKYCKPRTHSMLAVKASADVVKKLLEHSTAELACLNQPTGNVVSGTVQEIDRLRGIFKSQGFDTTQLDVPFAFHSSQVEPILEGFEAKARKVTFKAPSIPYVSPLLSKVVSNGETLNAPYLVHACRSAVNFQGALTAASESGIANEKTIWLEAGSHPACSGMIKGTLGSKSSTACTLRKDTDTWKVLISTLELLYLCGVEVDWNEYHRDFARCNAVLEMPRYSWDFKNYWIVYNNDFCLTKGAGMKQIEAAPVVDTPKCYKYLSPAIQRVIDESHGNKSSSMTIESDVKDSRLHPVFAGHRINGAELCPSSLYGDIAFHLAKYMMEQQTLDVKATGMDLRRMQVDRPLVSNPKLDSQLYRATAQADWSKNAIKVSIFSVNEKGTRTATHATCSVHLTPSKTWADEWKRSSYLVRSRMQTLRRAVEDGDSHLMKRRIVYRLFANIVDYSPDYQGMQEVVMDSNELEAFSTVKFQVGDKGFYFNPQWMDSMGGVAGFIMNGNPSPHPKAEVFINHGWDGFKLIGAPEYGKVYTCYNRMQHVEGTLYSGTTYLFDKDELIGIIEGIKFQGTARRVLDGLNPGGKAAQVKPATNPKPAPAPAATQKKKATATPPKQPVASSQPTSSWTSILAVIAEEVGVDASDLKPDTEFSELGLDSLLSLTITGRIREEIGIDLPSTIFNDCPTVKEFQEHDGVDSGSPLPPGADSSLESSSAGDGSGTSTPETSLDSVDGSVDYVHVIRSAIAEETGLKVEELLPSTQLDELGVDSLLALTTMSRLSEQFNVELPSNLFADNETLSEVECAIMAALGVNVKPSLPSPAAVAAAVTTSATYMDDPIVRNAPHATSLLLQGSPSSAKSTLFMFPDGSGSASSYATLARIDPKVAVYGLNCPWRTSPEGLVESGCNLERYSAKFVMELRRRQPTGPYHLGGWSAGGICAFEAARQLVAAGQVVDSLVLIDSPNPIGLQNPPARMYDFFQQLGIFGGGGSGSSIPKWLRAHFDAFIRILDDYKAVPWPENMSNPPQVLILYAKDGVCKDPNGPRPEIRPDDPREMIWLLNNRTDFSADGWASLVGRKKLAIEVLSDVNHFTMMDAGVQMDRMGAHIRKALV